jgi:putative endonuclease
MKQYFVYILTNKHNTVLYTGSTIDLVRRVHEHKNKYVEGFTSRYNVDRLVYYEMYSDPRNMVARERAIKNLVRRKKIALIESLNPEWKDIYTNIL